MLCTFNSYLLQHLFTITRKMMIATTTTTEPIPIPAICSGVNPFSSEIINTYKLLSKKYLKK